MTERIPLFDTSFGPAEQQAALSVLRSGWLTQGEQVQAFEREFSLLHENNEAVAVGSCTAALHLALRLANVGPGDEVVLPSLTFVATANAVRYVGATPVFADIESLTSPLLNVKTIERVLTPQTKAVIVVHYAGYAANMPEILALAKQHGLMVIEDAAHGPGKDENGRMLGCYGDFGCFSFYGNKNLSTGEGGMLLCSDAEQAERARRLRSHGMTEETRTREVGHAGQYDVNQLGYNYRFDELRAAIGRIQLPKLLKRNEKRRLLTSKYRELLSQTGNLTVPFAQRQSGSFHIFPILLPEGENRRRRIETMKAQGVFTSVHYPAIHRFSEFESLNHAKLKITENYSNRVLTLPLFPALTTTQIEHVVSALLH